LIIFRGEIYNILVRLVYVVCEVTTKRVHKATYAVL
jgi:hypothetical protein